MICTLESVVDFRTENIVKNIPVANEVSVKNGFYYIGFYTEYYNRELKKVVPGKIIYKIREDLVLSLKKHEKIESKSNT